jgi:hypothetical protein
LPVGFIKLGSSIGEAEALERLTEGAVRAGATVPRVLGRDQRALALSPVAGTPAAALLVARPHRGEGITRRLAAWLHRWHAAASCSRLLSSVDIDRFLLGPVRRLADAVPPSYADWLLARAASIEGREVSFAPAHQDLTMANVLFDGSALGIVDWETATDEALPFIDLPYAIADAATASERTGDRVRAFERCFGRRDSRESRVAQELLASASRVAGPDAVTLAFHACWLSHAVNDLGHARVRSPFVAIAAAVGADPSRYDLGSS